jgi:hypothetical protein
MKTKVSYLLLIYICIASTGNTFADIILAGYVSSNQKRTRVCKTRANRKWALKHKGLKQ